MDSFIGWIGGKKQLRHEILSRFPIEKPSSYIEVFGGAGWVFFAKDKQPGQLEVFNDANSDLINLFRCIKYHREAVVAELDCLVASRELFCDFREQMKVQGLTDIQRAARFFYLARISFGADCSSFATNTKHIDTAIKRLPEIQNRLSGVVVENKDFEDLIKVYDKQNALFYLDPPYHGTEKYYKNKFAEDDHYRLCSSLKKIKSRFILSYNDDEFIRNLYCDFNIEGISRRNTLAANVKGDTEYKELIIRNY